MKQIIYAIGTFFILFATSCTTNKKIEDLLKSSDKDDIISGAHKAGKKRNKVFVPLLLQNANDPRRSTNLKFKGISVYQAKMIALGKIFGQKPMKEVTMDPDSSVIKFYLNLAGVEQ